MDGIMALSMQQWSRVKRYTEFLSGDTCGSAKCDCGNQLPLAVQLIDRAGRVVVVYNCGHEGRGIGLENKPCAYVLQDAGMYTVDANVQLGLPVDSRDYYIITLVHGCLTKFMSLISYQMDITFKYSFSDHVTYPVSFRIKHHMKLCTRLKPDFWHILAS